MRNRPDTLDDDVTDAVHTSFHVVAVRHASALALVATLTACATFPGGVVTDRAQAIAIAERKCGRIPGYGNEPWHAELTGETWFVWRGPHAGLNITIDARDGRTDGCVAVHY